jgi:hypothetical protein
MPRSTSLATSRSTVAAPRQASWRPRVSAAACSSPVFADLYRALVRYALAPGSRAEERPPADAKILRWIESASVPLTARAIALVPQQAVSPLASRPYDLRHAAVSLWLNAGVPAPTVARRAGHSVDVLLRVYANCIDGDEEIANQRISGVLS